MIGTSCAEETEFDMPFEEVDESLYERKKGYSSTQVVNEERKLLTEKMIDDMLEVWIIDKNSDRYRCPACGGNPCDWLTNRQAMIEHDKASFGNLKGTDIPTNSHRRKMLFQKMFRVLNGGKGTYKLRKKHSVFVLEGIHDLFPDEEGDYMGHMDE